MQNALYSALFNVLKALFGEKTAGKIMAAVIIVSIIGIITSFFTSFGMAVISMMTVITPFVIGLTTIFTFGHVNLAAIIDHWLFATQAGAIFGSILAAVVFALFFFRLPTILNDWASSKISIK